MARRRGFSFAACALGATDLRRLLPRAERWRRMSTRAAVSQLPLLAIPSNLAPLGKLAGLFVAPVGLCAAAHQFARKGCSQSLRAVLLAAPLTLRSWGHESSFQSGLRNSPYIRARQHRCCECLARDCSAGFNEQLILSLRQTGGPVGRPSTPTSPRRENWRGFSLEFGCRAAGSADMGRSLSHDPGSANYQRLLSYFRCRGEEG